MELPPATAESSEKRLKYQAEIVAEIEATAIELCETALGIGTTMR